MRNAKMGVLLALLSCLSGGSVLAQQSPTAPAAEQALPEPHATQEAKHAARARDKPEDTPQAQEERAGAPRPVPRPDANAIPKPPPPRRSTPAHIQRVQPIPQAGAPSYGPVLTPGARPSPLPSPTPQAGLPPPAQLNSCAGGHCTDAAGNSYNLGTGAAGTDSQGRLCNRSGNTVQCF